MSGRDSRAPTTPAQLALAWLLGRGQAGARYPEASMKMLES